MSLLTKQQYKNSLNKKIDNLPIPLMMGFHPKAFEDCGYPTTISKKSDLKKFVDHNFEYGIDEIFKKDGHHSVIAYKNLFTSYEVQKLKKIRELIGKFTKKNYKSCIKPIGNLLVQSGPWRAIEQINSYFFKSKQLKIFEIGPGHGYLGALLSLVKYKYYSYDVTESLYLWQNHLLNCVNNGKLNEYLITNPKKFGSSKIGHLSWWQFCDFFVDNKLKGFDIVYSNSNLCEMHPIALKINLAACRELIKDSEIGVLMFFSEGSPSFGNKESINSQIISNGFQLLFTEPFNCYCLHNKSSSSLKKIFKNGINFLNKGDSFFEVKDFIDFNKNLPLDFSLTKKFYLNN